MKLQKNKDYYNEDFERVLKKVLGKEYYKIDLSGRRTLYKIINESRKQILRFIETERDNGNIEGEKGFSASLCLSKLMEKLK